MQVVVVGLTLLALQTGGTAKVEQGFPTWESASFEQGTKRYEAGPTSAARISFQTHTQALSFDWEYSGDGWKTVAEKVRWPEPLTYYPTALELLGNKLYVAGRSPQGETIVEEWTLAVPQINWFKDADSAQPVLQMVPPKPLRVLELYRAAEVGRDGIKALFLEVGTDNPRHVFAHFWDSRDVYKLNIETGVLKLAFSATPNKSAPVEPALKGRYNSVRARRHAIHGCLYIFDYHEPGLVNTGAPLVLRDKNSDGVLDDSLVIRDYETWAALGFAEDSANWLDREH